MPAMTVTGQSINNGSNGILLQVLVLTGAANVAAQSGATWIQSAAAAHQATASTTLAGSVIYGAILDGSSGTITYDASTTALTAVPDAGHSKTYITANSAATVTPGSVTFGITNSDNGGVAAYEVLPYSGGTIAVDGSSPAAVSTTTGKTVTTASFNPPAGSLLVALLSSDGNSSTITTAGVSDTLGLVWRPVAIANNNNMKFAGVWIADVPPPGPSTALVSPAWLNVFGGKTLAKRSVLWDVEPAFGAAYLTAGDLAFGASTTGLSLIPVFDPAAAFPGPATKNAFFGYFEKQQVLWDVQPAFGGQYLTAGDLAFGAITLGTLLFFIGTPQQLVPPEPFQNVFPPFAAQGRKSVLTDVQPAFGSQYLTSGDLAFGALTVGNGTFFQAGLNLSPGKVMPGPAWRNVFQGQNAKLPVLWSIHDPILGPYCLAGTEVDQNALGGTATLSVNYGGSEADTNLYGGSFYSGCTLQAVNITLGEFNDEVINLTITNNASAFNLSGYGLQALFKTAAGVPDTDPSTLVLSTGGGAIVITNASGGLATLTIPNADLQNTNFKFWRVDVTIGGTQSTAMYGTVTMLSL